MKNEFSAEAPLRTTPGELTVTVLPRPDPRGRFTAKRKRTKNGREEEKAVKK